MSRAEPTRSRWLPGTELAIAALVGAVLFGLTGVEIIWVVGGVAGGWVTCWAFRRRGAAAEPSSRVRELGQVLVGAAIGPTLAAQQFTASPGHLALLVAAVLAVLGGSLAVARLYCAYGQVDGVTAGMATLPGGLGIMPSVAAALGRPAGLVAIVQATRMTVVVVMVLAVLPVGAPTMTGSSRSGALLPDSPSGWMYSGGLLLGAFVAARVAARLRIPVPTLLGPLLFGCVFALGLRAGGVDPGMLAAPLAQEYIGQALLGITVGEYLAQRFTGAAAALRGGVAAVLVLAGFAVVLAFAMTTVSPWPFLTCLLMVAPGGAPEMVVIAAATDSELALVLAAQTGRQVLVNLLMPVWIRLFTRFDRA
nr:putative membrane protein [uncultured bacterium]